ncbi:retinoid-inducible serine carboxypeptidase-like isoform X2 [Onthophagus taurus]|uniref:retinoid-inducible serine carboxypeptidase-like isoform X2 n=1 Tax=Onthophagus taurus TaxID=166361 RepID=UPI0039BDD648
MSRSRWISVVFLCIPVGLILFYTQDFLDDVSIHFIGNTKQDWGFIEIDSSKNIFYWLYYTTANVTKPEERPLLIWLQGGPGIAASCYGNFMEIGPYSFELTKRNDTWIREFNVLFVDYPVEVGFSYKINKANAKLPKNITQVGDDLIIFAKNFFTEKPEWKNSSLYVFGQSYGAKFAVELANRIEMENKDGDGGYDFNLKGVGFFGGYISPIDFISNYGKIGYTLGLFDEHKFKSVKAEIRKINSAIKRKKFQIAHDLEKHFLNNFVDGFDIYNILYPFPVHLTNDNLHKDQINCNNLFQFVVQPYLKLKALKWTFFNTDCYENFEKELFQGVTEKVEYLLNNSKIKILVLTGILDYVVNVAGTVDWIKKLKWEGIQEWKDQKQTTFAIDNINEAFVRKIDRLSFYAVLRAGHSIPKDNPKAVLEILRREILEEFL